MSWQIKAKPGDFVVREMMRDTERWKDNLQRVRGGRPPKRGSGFLWMTMKKTDTDFFRALEMIARGLGKGTGDIGYAGTKDRKAVTFQTISVKGASAEAAAALEIPGIEFSGFRGMPRPVRLGDHEGNEFIVTIRNIREGESGPLQESLGRIREKGMLNLFGPQRFGSRGLNGMAGKHLVLGELGEAAACIARMSGPLHAGGSGSFEGARGRSKVGGEDAIFRLPARQLKLFIHAFQARIWNRAAAGMAAASWRQAAVPIPGYRTKLAGYPEARPFLEHALSEEGVSLSDFRSAECPRLSSKGSERELLCFPRGVSVSIAPDEANPGMMKATLGFSLGKGSYATELVRQLGEGGRLI